MPKAVPLRPIGAHAPVTGGPATGSLRYAAAVKAEAIQVFVTNPRACSTSAGDEGQISALREHVAATGLPVFVHAPYLINLGSTDPVVRERSAGMLGFCARRGAAIAALDWHPRQREPARPITPDLPSRSLNRG